jgi:hypothetical protein
MKLKTVMKDTCLQHDQLFIPVTRMPTLTLVHVFNKEQGLIHIHHMQDFAMFIHKINLVLFNKFHLVVLLIVQK